MTNYAEGDPSPYRFAELDSDCFIPRAPTGRSSALLEAAAAWYGPGRGWRVCMNQPHKPKLPPEDPDD